jgi:hypothetical protein
MYYNKEYDVTEVSVEDFLSIAVKSYGDGKIVDRVVSKESIDDFLASMAKDNMKPIYSYNHSAIGQVWVFKGDVEAKADRIAEYWFSKGGEL